MNIPTPTVEGGATPEEIKEAADKMAPPSSFYELQIASVRAAQDAIRDGYRLLEVEVSFVCLGNYVFWWAFRLRRRQFRSVERSFDFCS